MENEELEKLSIIEDKVKEKLTLISKINNPDDLDKNNKNLMKAVTKETYAERGRLLKIIKNNKDFIDELYNKYDMYINVFDILDREENDNYTKTDKINDIKNSLYKEEYTPFEESIIKVIDANIDDLDKMKNELSKLDSNGGIKKLIDLKNTYSEELKNHRKVIDSRYKDEFIHKKATIPTIVTVLPKAVGLAIEKVKVCIKERKEAKTNKEKASKMKKVLAAIGLVAATPVIYTGKFVIDHWYLLLLLLLSLPGFFPFFRKGKDPKSKDDYTEQPQEQEVYETETAGQPVLAGDEVKTPTGETLPAPEPKPIQQPKPAIDYAHDPRFNGQQAVQHAEAYSAEEKATVDEINNMFIDNLEQDYNYVIASRHPDQIVVHSAEDFVQAVKEINPMAPVTVENAEFFYQQQNSTPLRGIERPIIWPEGDTSIHFFENEQALANYIAEGGNPELNMYYNQFIQNGGNMSLLGQIERLYERSDYAEFMNKIGMGGAGAVMLFCLYEAAQYTLAAPTGGLTLALPF